jgi:hypothetical protein
MPVIGFRQAPVSVQEQTLFQVILDSSDSDILLKVKSNSFHGIPDGLPRFPFVVSREAGICRAG